MENNMQFYYYVLSRANACVDGVPTLMDFLQRLYFFLNSFDGFQIFRMSWWVNYLWKWAIIQSDWLKFKHFSLNVF